MVYCCVPFCKNRRGEAAGVSFHKFPYGKFLRNKWLEAVCRLGEDGKPWEPSYHSVVCSQHFKDEDYKCCKMNRTRLKPGRIPSLFPKQPKEISKRLRKMSSKLDENEEQAHSPTDMINIEEKASVKFEPVWLESSEESSAQEQSREFDPLEDGSHRVCIKSECAESDRD